MTKQKQTRQTKALSRLEIQISTGNKNSLKLGTIPLTDSDKNRINKEIEILKTRCY